MDFMHLMERRSGEEIERFLQHAEKNARIEERRQQFLAQQRGEQVAAWIDEILARKDCRWTREELRRMSYNRVLDIVSFIY